MGLCSGLKQTSYLNYRNHFLFQMSIAIFATYVLSSPENILDANKVFVTFSLVNSWSFALQLLPLAVNFTGQAWISAQRVKKFLMLEESDTDTVVHDPLAGNSLRWNNMQCTEMQCTDMCYTAMHWQDMHSDALTVINLCARCIDRLYRINYIHCNMFSNYLFDVLAKPLQVENASFKWSKDGATTLKKYVK